MPQISGVVLHQSDRSPASGRKVSGLAAGMLGGMVGPTYTDSKGRFRLSWSSSTRTLAKVYVDGNEHATDVTDGDERTYWV